MSGRAEAGGDANKLVGWTVGLVDFPSQAAHIRHHRSEAAAHACCRSFRGEIVQILLWIVPLIGVAPDNAATFGAAETTSYLAIDDHLSHESACVPARIADLHPAGGLGTNAECGNVLVVFAGVRKNRQCDIGRGRNSRQRLFFAPVQWQRFVVLYQMASG